MKVDWQQLLLVAIPIATLIAKDIGTQFTPGSIGATVCVTIALLLSAIKPSVIPSMNEAAVESQKAGGK